MAPPKDFARVSVARRTIPLRALAMYGEKAVTKTTPNHVPVAEMTNPSSSEEEGEDGDDEDGSEDDGDDASEEQGESDDEGDGDDDDESGEESEEFEDQGSDSDASEEMERQQADAEVRTGPCARTPVVFCGACCTSSSPRVSLAVWT